MVPLNLILNGLLTNSYKYVFTQINEPQISIHKKETNYQLIYSDNGIGISNKTNILNSGTLGLELIHILSDQLKGRVKYTKTSLSKFTIEFNQL